MTSRGYETTKDGLCGPDPFPKHDLTEKRLAMAERRGRDRGY